MYKLDEKFCIVLIQFYYPNLTCSYHWPFFVVFSMIWDAALFHWSLVLYFAMLVCYVLLLLPSDLCFFLYFFRSFLYSFKIKFVQQLKKNLWFTQNDLIPNLLYHVALIWSFVTCPFHLGFTSIDCGGAESHTDEIGLEWVLDDDMVFGQTTYISVPGETRKQYSTLRYFPADERKYCYTLNVASKTRYLVRATFLYGNFDKSNVYPRFDISLGPTHWWTVVIDDENRIEVREIILLAQSSSISVCLSNARTGQPFISTLELRQFNNSMYLSDYEMNFYLFVSARINFGALSDEPIRYVTFFFILEFHYCWQAKNLSVKLFLHVN